MRGLWGSGLPNCSTNVVQTFRVWLHAFFPIFRVIKMSVSFAAKEDFAPLGSIAVERAFDGNYTASFQFSGSSNTWRSQLLNAAQNGWPYRVRADGGAVQGYNEPVGKWWTAVLTHYMSSFQLYKYACFSGQRNGLI